METYPASLQFPRPYVPDLAQPTRQLMIGPGHPVIMVRSSWVTAWRAGTATPTS